MRGSDDIFADSKLFCSQQSLLLIFLTVMDMDKWTWRWDCWQMFWSILIEKYWLLWHWRTECAQLLSNVTKLQIQLRLTMGSKNFSLIIPLFRQTFNGNHSFLKEFILLSSGKALSQDCQCFYPPLSSKKGLIKYLSWNQVHVSLPAALNWSLKN